MVFADSIELYIDYEEFSGRRIVSPKEIHALARRAGFVSHLKGSRVVIYPHKVRDTGVSFRPDGLLLSSPTDGPLRGRSCGQLEFTSQGVRIQTTIGHFLRGHNQRADTAAICSEAMRELVCGLKVYFPFLNTTYPTYVDVTYQCKLPDWTTHYQILTHAIRFHNKPAKMFNTETISVRESRNWTVYDKESHALDTVGHTYENLSGVWRFSVRVDNKDRTYWKGLWADKSNLELYQPYMDRIISEQFPVVLYNPCFSRKLAYSILEENCVLPRGKDAALDYLSDPIGAYVFTQDYISKYSRKDFNRHFKRAILPAADVLASVLPNFRWELNLGAGSASGIEGFPRAA